MFFADNFEEDARPQINKNRASINVNKAFRFTQ